MSTSTLPGGGKVNTGNGGSGNRMGNSAQKALGAANKGHKPGVVNTHLATPPTKGAFNVYTPTGVKNGSEVKLPVGGQALVAQGSLNLDVVGNGASGTVLIGNSGNDTINMAGGSGTIISGTGHDYIELNNNGLAGGSVYIVTGDVQDTINMTGGSATIAGNAQDLVNLRSGNNTVQGVGPKGLEVNVLGGSNVIGLAGTNVVTFNGTSSDTVTTGSGSKDGTDLTVRGSTNLHLTAHAGDKLVVQSGTNTIHADGSLHATVIGGTNEITVEGGSNVILNAGITGLTVGGTGSSITEHGGGNTVDIVTGAKDTVTVGGKVGSAIHLGGGDTVNVVGGSSTISEAGTGSVLNLSLGGADTITATGGTINLDNGNYTLVVNGTNDTINFGNGKDTVIHGNATITSHNGVGTVTGGARGIPLAGSGHATLLGGSAAHAFPTTAAHAAGGASSGSTLFTFGGQHGTGAHGVSFLGGSEHINLVHYAGAAPMHLQGGGTAITLDHSGTKIVLEGFSHH